MKGRKNKENLTKIKENLLLLPSQINIKAPLREGECERSREREYVSAKWIK